MARSFSMPGRFKNQSAVLLADSSSKRNLEQPLKRLKRP